MNRRLRAANAEGPELQRPHGRPGCMAWARRRLVAAVAATLLGAGPLLAGEALANTARGAAIVTLPPSAGRVLAVQERGEGLSLQQRVTLSGGSPGQNFIDIRVGERAPTAREVALELFEQFPGVDMRPLSHRSLRTSGGRLQVAIGAPGAGGRCLYAWGEARDLARAGDHRASLFQRATPASLRIRLCSATATLDQLAEMSEQVAIGGLSRVFGADAATASMREGRDRGLLARDRFAMDAEPQAAAWRPSAPAPELYDAEPAEATPRIVLAQARRSSGGGLLERSAGNPGGLIGLLRGYRRTDPITSSGNYAPRKRRAAPTTTRRARPAARVARPAPETYTPPDQSRPQVAPETAQQPQAPAGYREPGTGARYLGPIPGAVPEQAPARGAAAPSLGANTPAVPAPAAARPGAAPPAPVGSAPITRGLDPSLPGRALRGPTGG